MKLLALTTSYPLRQGGCAGVFVQNLYRHLSEGHTVDVICPGDSEASPAAFRDPAARNIQVRAVRYAPRTWRTLAQGSGGIVTSLRRAPWRVLLLPMLLGALSWRCLLLSAEADLIHANWAICGVLAGIVGRLRNRPVITTLRGGDVTRAMHSRIDRMILALAVRNSRIVVCVSEAMASQVRARFPQRAADVYACLNGVDEAFLQIARPAPDAQATRALAVGSLIRRKGFDVLIEAVARMRHREKIHVRIVGAGPEREALAALAQARGVSSSVGFAGNVQVADMPEVYSAADLFVLSSRSEGRPNVVVEALASGLPVVSTDLEGVHGMVLAGETGWLVPVADADAMASALDQAVGDRADTARRGARARLLARTRIGTWADTAHGYEALFKAAMAPGPPCAA